MHRTFRRLLPAAEGQSQWVIAVNADIRDFTSKLSADPAETALYLKHVYERILDSYFQGASFFKPTGDGLVIVLPFAEADHAVASAAVIDDAISLANAFGSLVDDERMIQFPHPDAIGIGVSAGSASRIVSGRTTLDYAGRVLNVASRLMDLARPSGVVFDSTLDTADTEESTLAEFASADVYLKGVAETQPLHVFYSAEATIPEHFRKPIQPDRWHDEAPQDMTVAQARRRGEIWLHELDFEPTDRSKIAIALGYPRYKGGKRVKGIWARPDLKEFTYALRGLQPTLEINWARVISLLQGVPANAMLRVEIGYPIAPPPEEEAPEVEVSDEDIPF